jgi:hypothetical protein
MGLTMACDVTLGVNSNEAQYLVVADFDRLQVLRRVPAYLSLPHPSFTGLPPSAAR